MSSRLPVFMFDHADAVALAVGEPDIALGSDGDALGTAEQWPPSPGRRVPVKPLLPVPAM
jgi:hypothetical protein